MFRLGELIKIKDSIADYYKINQSCGVVIKVYLNDVYEIRMMELHVGPPGDIGTMHHYTIGFGEGALEHV